MFDDPIVEEVRKYRQANAAKFGYNVRAIAEDARKREKTSGHPIVNLQELDRRRGVGVVATGARKRHGTGGRKVVQPPKRKAAGGRKGSRSAAKA